MRMYNNMYTFNGKKHKLVVKGMPTGFTCRTSVQLMGISKSAYSSFFRRRLTRELLAQKRHMRLEKKIIYPDQYGLDVRYTCVVFGAVKTYT